MIICFARFAAVKSKAEKPVETLSQKSVAPYSTDNYSNGFAIDSLRANCSILTVY